MSDSEEYSLYVSDLPPDLGKPGMHRIFSQFGAVKTILLPEDAKFAFVVYSTYSEAEAAINGLDSKAPLFLKVSFRKQKNSDGLNHSSKINGNHSPAISVETQRDFRYSNPLLPPKSRMQYGDLDKLNRPGCGLSPHHYHMESNGYVPSPNCQVYDPYEDLDYASTNAMWSRGCLSIDAAGRRHVSMGRGHTYYHIPHPYPNIEDHIGKVYEVRNPGCYRYGIDELQHNVGKCMLCSRDAILLCSQCDGYYCTRECQAKDWSKHKNECSKLPPLTYATSVGVPVPSSNHLPKTNSQQQSSDNPEQVIYDVSQKQLTRSQSTRVENNNPSPIVQRSVSYDCNNHKVVDTSKRHNPNEVPSKMRMPSQETLDKPTSGLANRLQNARSAVVKADDDDFVFKRSEFLSKVEFTEVQIAVVLEPGLYYVQKTSDIPKLEELMITLQKKASHFPIVSKVVVGKIYCALYSGDWHRAMVLSESPMKIDYIDYGTIEEVRDMEFRELGELAGIPRFSQVIKLSTNTIGKFKSLIEECILNVRMINIDNDGTINVEIMNDTDAAVSNGCELAERLSNVAIAPQSPSPSVIRPPREAKAPEHPQSPENLPSVLDKMVSGMDEITAGFTKQIDEHTMLAVLLFEGVEDDFTSLLEPLEQECEAAALKYKNFRPQLGELVCAKKPDGSWVRGTVTAISPTIIIASLDEGITAEVDQTIPILPRFKQICTFSAKLTTSCKFPAKQDSQVNLKVTDRKLINGETVVMCEFTSEGFTGISVEARKWILPHKSITCEVRKPKLVPLELKNNSQVTIQAHRGTSIVFLRSLEEQEHERYCRLTQDIAKAALVAPNLSSLPSPGDLVFAKYLDDNYYRALVIAVDDDDIKIGYIDYGNNEVTKLDKLKEMPISMQERPRASVRVFLKGIKNVPPTNEAIEYLGMLAANETPFICSFDGTVENGVTLKTAAGESVNDFVNDFLTPSYKKMDEKEDADYLQLNDMDIGVLGKVGDTVNAYFLDTIEAGSKYVFAPMDDDLIRHISEVLPTLLDEYCETVKKYIPRANELCIAKFDGGWYRGCCVKPSLTPSTAEIYFLDFGNVSEVNHEDIRIMKKDFLKPAPLGCICNVKGLVQEAVEPSPGLLAKLETLLKPNELCKINILKYEDLEWAINLLDVHETLVKEGLISS